MADPGEPAVLGAVNLGLRAGIVGAKVGAAVTEWVRARDAGALGRLDGARVDGWAPLRDHVLLIDGLAAVIGLDRVRPFARARMRDGSPGSPAPAVVDAWTRSFAGDPVSTLRVCLHLWRNAFRDAGEMLEVHAAPGEYSVRFVHSPLLASSAAWREVMVGSALGIADRVGTEMHAELSVPDAETVDCTLRWEAVAAASAGT